MKVTLSDKVEISSEVLCQEVSGETVLLDLKSEAYFGLDSTGTRIWQLISESGDLQSAFDSMLAEYEVEEEQLHREFTDLLVQLAAEGLVSICPAHARVVDEAS